MKTGSGISILPRGSVRIRVANLAWWILLAAIVSVWVHGLHPSVAGVDARYYFKAALDMQAGRNPYLSGDFLYPPATAWLLVPAVHGLSDAALAIGFNLLIYASVIMLAAGSFLLAGMKPGFGRNQDWWLIPFLLAFLLFSPVTAIATGLGNISPLVGALCVWAGYLHSKNRPAGAVLLVAAATILKIVPGLLLVFLFWRSIGTRDRRLLGWSLVGIFVAAAGILLPPGTADFLRGAGGDTKWGIDIGGAAVSIHVLLARVLDLPALNHPDIAMVIFGIGAILASGYGYFLRHRETVAWVSVMVLCDVTSPKNCPHLFLALGLPVIAMFARHTAAAFAVETTAGSEPPGRRRTSSGGFVSLLLSGEAPPTTGITRLGGFFFSLALPWIAVSSEYFYMRGSLAGEIILPVIPVILLLLQTWVINRWNRTEPTNVRS
mgnify:CR=1 FL=1